MTTINLFNIVGHKFRRKLCYSVFALLWFAVVPAAATEENFVRLVDAAENLELYKTELDFFSYLQRARQRSHRYEFEDIQSLSSKLSAFDTEKFGSCERLALDDTLFKLRLASERFELLGKIKKPLDAIPRSFQSMSDGMEWYRHWLSSWLQDDVSFARLEAIAFAELEDVARKEKQIPGRSERELLSYGADDASEIVAIFREFEEQVYRNNERILGTGLKAPPVNIEQSRLPESFPAPGIYDSRSNTFYYHLQNGIIPRKSMDWLFLHEAVPGHHFFDHHAEKSVACPQFRHRHSTTVFSEGWSAYVETLGKELGLYSDYRSYRYALDWQALRAVRVLVDIGIHAKGWSDQQALDVMTQYIPEQKAIMAREIERIKKWPGQVHTYVYGKSVISAAVKRFMDRPLRNSRSDIHRRILRYSNHSIRSLRFLNLT